MVGKMSYTKIDGRTIKVSKFCKYFNSQNKEDEFIIDENATYQVQLYCEKWFWKNKGENKECYRVLGIRFDKKIADERLEENPFKGREKFHGNGENGDGTWI